MWIYVLLFVICFSESIGFGSRISINEDVGLYKGTKSERIALSSKLRQTVPIFFRDLFIFI